MVSSLSVEKLRDHGINNIPIGWKISKVKYLGNYINGYAFKPTDWSSVGKPILRIQNLTSSDNEPNRYDGELHNKYLVKKNDILISWSGSIGVYRWLNEDSWLNQHIFKVEVNKGIINDDYFMWLAEWFVKELSRDTHGSTMQHLTTDAFGSFPVIIPPFEVQKKISSFLKTEINQIDKLIKAKNALLKIIYEKKLIGIRQIVTKGINSTVKLKDSNVDWIGQVPIHWNIERSKWLLKEINQRSETGEEDLLTVSHITGVTLRSEKDVNMFEADTTEGYKLCLKNDLVINTLWAWMGAMGIAPINGIVSPAYHVYRLGGKLYPKYVDYLVRIPVFAKEVTRYSKGVWSSRLRLYPDGLYETYWPLPPFSEQIKIVDFLDNEINSLDNLILETEKSINLLNQRKHLLISDLVTGKIEL